MAAVEFEPNNYKTIITDPSDNKIYYTEEYLNQMIAHYFGESDEVDVVKEKLQKVPAAIRARIQVQMAVVIISAGNLTRLDGAIRSAEVDYRDVLMELR